MIEQASVAIERSSLHERAQRESKYSRRNKMRYIDQLLNELEVLNLAEKTDLPEPLETALDRVLAEIGDERSVQSVGEAMDLLYDLQDQLMDNQED